MRVFFVLLLLALTPFAQADLSGLITEDQTCAAPGAGGYDPALWTVLPEGEGMFSGQGTYDGASLKLWYMNGAKTATYAYPGVEMAATDAQAVYLGTGLYVCVAATDTDSAGGNDTQVAYEVIPIRTRTGGGAWKERTLGALPAQ